MPFNQINQTTLTDYQVRTLNEKNTLAALVSPFYPCEVMGLFYEYDGADQFERAELRITLPDLVLVVSEIRGGKYTVNCPSLWDLKSVTPNTVQSLKEGLSEPNPIVVFTTNKLRWWVEYYEDLYHKSAAVNVENEEKKSSFVNSLADLDVQWLDNNTRGRIVKGGIEFTFHLHETGVNTNMEIYYGVGSDIATFLKMADNKLAV